MFSSESSQEISGLVFGYYVLFKDKLCNVLCNVFYLKMHCVFGNYVLFKNALCNACYAV